MTPMTDITFVTALYAGILALFLVPMAALIVRQRFKAKIGLGTGRAEGLEDEVKLLQRVRVMGNFLEYVPIILFLMLVLELSNTCESMLHILGITLVLARVLHAVGLYKSTGSTPWRFLGTILTWACLIGAAVLSILSYTGGIGTCPLS